MQKNQTLKRKILKKYRAPDGGATPHALYFRAPHQPHLPRTVHHQNLPLFTVMLYEILSLHGWLDGRDYKYLSRTIRLTQVDSQKDTGLYFAAPGWHSYHFSHDNQVAWVYACVWLQDYDRLNNMIQYGLQHGWQFNPVGIKAFRLRSMRQPADVAWYKLCAGKMPGLFQWIHLCAKLIFTSFQLKRVSLGIKISEANLTYFRLKALRLAFNDHKNKVKRWSWFYCVPLLIGKFWDRQLMKHTEHRGMRDVWKHFWAPSPEIKLLINHL